MFSQAMSQIGERIRELETRLATLEAENKSLDETLGDLRLKHVSSDGNSREKLKFFPMASKVDAEFFRVLGDKKLNEFKLSDEPVAVQATYMVTNGKNLDKAFLELRAGSFGNLSEHLFSHERIAAGILLNVNTAEQFKGIDKKALLKQCANKLLSDIDSGSIFTHPNESLARFCVLTFADLKMHKCLYWFGFPAFGFHQGEPIMLAPPVTLNAVMPGLFETFSSSRVDSDQDMSFFYLEPATRTPRSFVSWPTLPNKHEVDTFGFIDSSPTPENPGWFLRNFLVFATHRQGLDMGGRRVKIVCIRDIIAAAPRPAEHSVVLDVQIPSTFDADTVTGWEPNTHDKMGPRALDLSDMLDEAKLSETALNLNLKLMKWRAFPELDDQKLATCRVLLLGSGTLGCAVARGLMGWGFRNFTFCDGGKVSYSNPARQSLFMAADCANGGRFKAEVAAERCRGIYPNVKVDHWIGMIPMPGHSGDPRAESEFKKLEELIVAHDVICLLTDTRESRWLPTVIGAAHDKLVLNAALGFDSFVVMRHGSPLDPYGQRLGCYFCSDVVAPTDSTRDRTLDQQCTVTRPGAAPIAGAILVEMLVSLLHHPLGPQARPNEKANKLGIVPHQVRGFLGSFQNDVILGQAFPQCTACSDAVLNEYRTEGFEFVRSVLEDPNILERVTGLDKLKSKALGEDEGDDFVLDDDDDVMELDN